MSQFVKAIDLLNYGVLYIISIVFGIVTFLTVYQVFARYVLQSPLVWSEALIRYAMVWIVLLGTAVALRKGLLISVEAVLFLVPKKIKKAMKYLIVVINAVFLVLLIVYGLQIMQSLSHSRTGAIDIPISWVYAAIPVGSTLALINCIAVFIDIFKNAEEGEQDGGPIIH